MQCNVQHTNETNMINQRLEPLLFRYAHPVDMRMLVLW